MNNSGLRTMNQILAHTSTLTLNHPPRNIECSVCNRMSIFPDCFSQAEFECGRCVLPKIKRLDHFHELDAPSLSVVQLLLLTGIYLQSTRFSYRCLNTIGLALRVAQGLGLHVDKCTSPFESQKQREMRRRVWYICVMMDSYVSSVRRPQ